MVDSTSNFISSVHGWGRGAHTHVKYYAILEYKCSAEAYP